MVRHGLFLPPAAGKVRMGAHLKVGEWASGRVGEWVGVWESGSAGEQFFSTQAATHEAVRLGIFQDFSGGVMPRDARDAATGVSA
jgi:hypothetical protein